MPQYSPLTVRTATSGACPIIANLGSRLASQTIHSHPHLHPATASTAFANGSSLPFGGGGIYFVNPHLHTPYTYQYNLSVQHELARNLIAEANYVGSSSKGLTSLVDVNPFDLSTVNGPNPTRILNENQNAGLNDFCATNYGGLALVLCPLRWSLPTLALQISIVWKLP